MVKIGQGAPRSPAGVGNGGQRSGWSTGQYSASNE